MMKVMGAVALVRVNIRIQNGNDLVSYVRNNIEIMLYRILSLNSKTENLNAA